MRERGLHDGRRAHEWHQVERPFVLKRLPELLEGRRRRLEDEVEPRRAAVANVDEELRVLELAGLSSRGVA